jgi:hypothetical protein
MVEKLKNAWSFWYHEIKTEDWSKESYVFIHKVKTLEEVWGVLKLITPQHLKNGMYFIMKNDIFPEWSSDENKHGGYWSVKLQEVNMEQFHRWIIYMITENLYIHNKGTIQGLSYSPKFNHGILKIWNNDSKYCDLNYFHKNLNTIGCKYTIFMKKK